jgi:alanine dehydrogenase
MIPGSVMELTKRGHQVLVQRGAGQGASYDDALYQAAGAEIVGTAAEIFERAKMIVKVKEPRPLEIALPRPDHLLFTYLHLNPTYEEEGVPHYCVANLPGAYSRTATQALNNVTHPWTMLIAENGLAGACKKRPKLLKCINTAGGNLTCEPVAIAHDQPFVEPSAAIS